MLPSIKRLIHKANLTPINAVQVHFRGFLVTAVDDFELDSSVDITNLTSVVGAVVSKYGTSPISFRRYQYIHGRKKWLDKGIVYLEGELISIENYLKDPNVSDTAKRNAKIVDAKTILKTRNGDYPFNGKEDYVVHAIKD